MKPLSAVFFLTELGGGGAESHALRVMNHLDRGRVSPSLAVCRRGGSYEPFLRSDVDVHAISVGRLPSAIGRALLSGPGLAALVKRLHADVVVSVMDIPNLVSIASLRPLRNRPRLVACVQIPPTIPHSESVIGRRFVLPGIRRLYPLADAVIALSHGVRDDLVGLEPSIGSVTQVIHNACVDERVVGGGAHDDAPSRPKVPVLLAAGRLSHQKGYPHLLRAFRLLRDTHEAELWILGEGPDRKQIEGDIVTLGLADAVKLFGFQADPFSFMRKATVFVLSSLYEGFGNVIVEAMACGLPVISTDCPYGPSEIIRDGVDGLLVPVADPDALANSMRRMLDDASLRERLRDAALERANAFTAPAVASQYADALERVCRR